MTVIHTGAALGGTAGTAGEINAVQLVRSSPGWWTSPLGVEHRLSQYVLRIAFALRASFAVYPDHLAYRCDPAFMFAMNVTGLWVPRNDGHELDFAIKPAAVNGLIAFSNATHLQAVHVVVPWNPAEARVLRPFEVEAFPMDGYGNYVVRAEEAIWLSDWLEDPEPYVGGTLARNWPQALPR
jgi:hypothetical protein